MLEAGEGLGSYPDLTEGPPAWHKPGDARYGFSTRRMCLEGFEEPTNMVQ